MTGYIKELRTAIFHRVLDLIEREYNKHFDYIIIIRPTLQWNKTYHSKACIKNDDKVWLIRPKYTIYLKRRCNRLVTLNGLYNWIKILSQMLAHSEALFIINDIITDKSLAKRRQSLLELAISGRHRDHYYGS